MTQMDARLGHQLSGSDAQVDDDTLKILVLQIREIGLARFVGRINAGVIDADEGYAAVERFVSMEKKRPLLSTLGQVLMGRSDSYAPDTQF